MSEKGGVREVLQARGIVRHDILFPWEEMGEVAVAVHPLMITRETTEGCYCSVTGYRSFPDVRHGWSVVTEVLDGGVSERSQGTHDIDLRQ